MLYLQNFADEAMNIQLLLNIVDKATNIKLKLFHIMGCPTFRVRNAYSYAARNQSHAILM